MGDGRDKTAKGSRHQIMQDLRGKAFSEEIKKEEEGLEPRVPSLRGSFKSPANV